MEPWTTARAEQYVSTVLGVPEDLHEMLHWDRLMGDLYRAADCTWNVHLISGGDLWAILYANRRAATNDERAALVRSLMATDREDMGADESIVREMMRDHWARRRAETDHRTYAVPFRESVAVPMTAAEYDRALTLAADGDQGRALDHVTADGARQGIARHLFDVMVLA